MKQSVLKIINWFLATLARRVIDRHKPFVVAITGSVGKTTTRDAVYRVLADHFGEDKVRKNSGNLNTEIGVPLTILGYNSLPNKFLWPVFIFRAYLRTFQKDYPKYLVLEMGIDHKGDMAYLASIAKPDLGIITAAAPAHTANFTGGLNEYLFEKTMMAVVTKKEGKVFVNGDYEILKKLPNENLVTVGIKNKDADYVGESINVTLQGMEYRIAKTGQKIAIKTKLLGRHLIYSQLIAFAVGQYFGIQSLKIKNSLESILPVNGRMNLLPGKNKTWIIDDTYNAASPASVIGALELISEIKHPGRKVAIIGNMNELGILEVEAHEEVGKIAKDSVDLAIFAGPNAYHAARAFHESYEKVLVYSNRLSLEKRLPKIINEGDIILVKASQNKNYFEEVVKALMQEPEKASELLVRQSKWWLNKKTRSLK
ncbi:MAG TPA: UDP-N-acetylmuramoyl-tripeptide--D-alanyl-D-alanine ligase [bacterium]|nr:UDP-N-acetylmuramoyl-tripeptide--D-alanyl-D-alanine ligase [bacterium]